jgi:signal transduction histidine kinase
MTEQVRILKELRVANEELQTVNRIIATTTTTTTEVQDILENVLDHALAVTGLEGGTICMVTEDDTLHLAAHRATSATTIKDLSTNAVRVGECLCGECARDHRPLVLHDREEVHAFATREAIRGEDIRFHAAFPLVAAEECLGVLCVFTRTDAKPSERSLKLLESVSAQIAMAVRNAQLHEEMVQLAKTLEDKVRARTLDLEEARAALISNLEDMKGKSEALAEANDKLQGLDRLKSLFIASMSHELRTPLNSVIGFSSILKEEWLGPVNDEQKKNLGYILDSGKHLLALINDVIDLSKVEAGRLEITPTRFSLPDLVAEAVNAIQQSAADKGLEINTRIEPCALFADRRRLLQCLLNLLSNAVKFTAKGSIAVTAETGAGKDENAVVKIIVKDTGIGIPPEDQGKLFKPFVRLHSPGSSEYPGTGLGLYLTGKLVNEVLQGEIHVASTHGAGSRFTIEMPVMAPRDRNVGMAEQPAKT